MCNPNPPAKAAEDVWSAGSLQSAIEPTSKEDRSIAYSE